MPKSIEYGPASQAEVATIVNLCMIVERQHEQYWPLRWQLRDGLERGWGGWLSRHLNDPDMLVLSARDPERGGEVVGTLVAEIEEEMPIYTYKSFGFIHDVAVLPEYRGQGVGRALLQMAREWAKSRGVNQLRLMVAHDNPEAARLFERAGFKDTYREMVLPVGDE